MNQQYLLALGSALFDFLAVQGAKHPIKQIEADGENLIITDQEDRPFVTVLFHTVPKEEPEEVSTDPNFVT